MTVDGMVNRTCYGVFSCLNMFRPSCRPNVHPRWNRETRTMHFCALRDIPQGETLSITLDPAGLLLPSKDRLKRLEAEFKTSCMCEQCALREPISDAKRSRISKVIEQDYASLDSSEQLQAVNLACYPPKEPSWHRGRSKKLCSSLWRKVYITLETRYYLMDSSYG